MGYHMGCIHMAVYSIHYTHMMTGSKDHTHMAVDSTYYMIGNTGYTHMAA